MAARPAWLLGLPLAVLGWLAAHSAAYELAAGGDGVRMLAATGHGYLDHAPLAVALCLVLAAAGFLARAQGRRGRPVPGWLLGALPLVGFALQEYLERLLHGGPFWSTALEPVFVLGLLLQLPFALGAALLARSLTGLADVVAGCKAANPRLGRPPVATLPAATGAWISAVVATGNGVRAPPVPA